MDLSTILQQDFTYDLPQDRIAKHPIEPRDASKLLVYKNKKITHTTFNCVTNFVPANATIFFNNTKVIPARLFFQKDTGAVVEVFLLNPVEPPEISQAMSENRLCVWACKIGKLRRIKDDTILYRKKVVDFQEVILEARLLNREKKHIAFSWNNPKITFTELLHIFGVTPLPPYLKRVAQTSDQVCYQTVYSQHEGAVAAPTAGLHFTETTLNALHEKGVTMDYLTLHVSGATFQPIQSERIIEHPMHSEQVCITRNNIDSILNAEQVLSVGTTSMRTLESLYWFGVKLKQNPNSPFFIEKLYPYQSHLSLPSISESMCAILDYMARNGLEKLNGFTEIMIMPSYQFKVCKILMTNFHLPSSTLIMLVSAFVDGDWHRIYDQALQHNYRFLSYGDSSLLFL